MTILKLVEQPQVTVRQPNWSEVYEHQIDVDFASDEWAILVSELKSNNTYSPAILHTMERLIHARVAFNQAQRQVGRYGTIVISTKTSNAVQNRYWTIVRQADAIIRAIEAELCISPYRRGKAGKIKAGGGKTLADQYISSI